MAASSLAYLVFAIVALLGVFISSFLVKMIFGVLTNLDLQGSAKVFLRYFQNEITLPTVLVMQFGFGFWLLSSLQRFLNVEDGDADLASNLFSALFFVLKFLLYLTIVFLVYRTSTWIINCSRYLFDTKYKKYRFYKHGVLEAINVVSILILVALFFVLFISIGGSNGVVGIIFDLLSTLNLFSVTIALSLTPLIRDIMSGIYVLTNRYFEQGDFIQIVGVGQPGYVVEFRLRLIVLQALDKSLVYIPNGRFLYYVVINFTRKSKEELTRYRCEFSIPILESTKPAKTKTLLRDIGTTLRDRNNRTGSAAVDQMSSASLFNSLASYSVNVSASFVSMRNCKGVDLIAILLLGFECELIFQY